MTECIVCKKREANIRIRTDVIIHVCGQSDCKSKDGLTVSEWILQGSNDPKDLNSNYNAFVKDIPTIIVEIAHKQYKVPNDKRVLKGLKTKLQELVIKHSGIETDHTD